MNLINLLAEGSNPTNWLSWVLIGAVVVLFVVWFVLRGRKDKSRQREYVEQLEAIKPGNKVKTAGGICGIVVEVCDDNTIIIETGSEQSGKSYVKMDKECIYQTDAKGPTQLAREEAEARKKAEKEGKAAEKAAANPEKAPEVVKEEPAEADKKDAE